MEIGMRSSIKTNVNLHKSQKANDDFKLHDKCPGCGEHTLSGYYQQGKLIGRNPNATGSHDKFLFGPSVIYCHCNNDHCPLHTVTLLQTDFMKLTPTQIHDYGERNRKYMEDIKREQELDNRYQRSISKVKNNGSPPLFKLDFPSIPSKDKCPSCGSTLYKFDDKSLKQESENSFRECKNKSCRLYEVVLPLGRMSDISDLEIHNFRNRQDRQDELAKGKSPFEAYDATSDKSIPDGDRLDKLRDYRYSKVKTVVKRQFIKTGR